MSESLSSSLSIYLSVCLSFFLSVYVFIYLSIYLSMCWHVGKHVWFRVLGNTIQCDLLGRLSDNLEIQRPWEFRHLSGPRPPNTNGPRNTPNSPEVRCSSYNNTILPRVLSGPRNRMRRVVFERSCLAGSFEKPWSLQHIFNKKGSWSPVLDSPVPNRTCGFIRAARRIVNTSNSSSKKWSGHFSEKSGREPDQ